MSVDDDLRDSLERFIEIREQPPQAIQEILMKRGYAQVERTRLPDGGVIYVTHAVKERGLKFLSGQK